MTVIGEQSYVEQSYVAHLTAAHQLTDWGTSAREVAAVLRRSGRGLHCPVVRPAEQLARGTCDRPLPDSSCE